MPVARGVTAPVLVFFLLALGSAPASAADYAISMNPDPPNAGQPVTLSPVPEPPADATVAWDLDDAGDFELSGRTVTHTFTQPGPVNVRMRVTGGDEKKTTVGRTVTVNAAPSADFTFAPVAPLTGQDVVFTPVVSDPEGDGVSFTWSFGDGALSTDTAPAHAYASSGTFTTVLTAVDEHGAFGTAQHDVRVTDPAPGDTPPAEGPTPAGPAPPDAQPPAPATGGGGTPAKPRPVRMRPFPVVRIAGVVLEHGALVRVLSVRAPRGSSVRVRCRGHACPAGSAARSTTTSRIVRFHRFERRLQAGTVLELFVRKAGRIGKYTRFAIRGGKPPARIDRCLMPGRARPVRCA